MAKFPGVPLKVGDETLIVPALSLGQLRNGMLAKLQEHDKLIAEGRAFDSLAVRGEIILAAIRRNYPDYDEQELFDHLDMSNTAPIWLAVLGASGFNVGERTAGTETRDVPAMTPGT